MLLFINVKENRQISKRLKPKITPITINRTDKSDFVKMIEERKVNPIEPVFVDVSKNRLFPFRK